MVFTLIVYSGLLNVVWVIVIPRGWLSLELHSVRHAIKDTPRRCACSRDPNPRRMREFALASFQSVKLEKL